MRIGQFTDSFLPVVDGVGRVVASYANTMGNMGEQVTVFAAKADMGEISTYPYDIVTYNAFNMPGKMPYRIGFPQLDIRFEKRVQNMPLDIVHVHSPFMAGHAGLHLAKKRGIPVVASFHSKYYDDFSQVLKVDMLAKTGVKLVVDFYEQCDEVWAVSSATADTLVSYGYQGKVIAMPNGTDIRTLDEGVLPELKARYGIKEDVALLLYVGQLNWKKNILRILEAARLLKDEGVAFQLMLAGQGPHQAEIAEKAEALGLGDRVIFPGHVQSTRELDGLYALASLFVFPSLYDNAPMVLREAAAMGTPAVLVDGSTSAEAIVHGENGLTCKDDAQSLADTVRAALADKAKLRQMGDAARETIPVSWEMLVQEILERYERLIRR